MIGVQALGLAELGKKIAGLPQRLSLAERRAVAKGAVEVLRELGKRVSLRSRSKVPVGYLHRRTGALAGSAGMTQPEREGASWLTRVGFRRGAAERYAPVHEFGATIRARNKPYLVFPIREVGGLAKSNIIGWVRTKEVRIPERRPLRSALAAKRDAIREHVRQEIGRALEAAWRG